MNESLNLSLNSGSLKDLMEILDLCHQMGLTIFHLAGGLAGELFGVAPGSLEASLVTEELAEIAHALQGNILNRKLGDFSTLVFLIPHLAVIRCSLALLSSLFKTAGIKHFLYHIHKHLNHFPQV